MATSTSSRPLSIPTPISPNSGLLSFGGRPGPIGAAPRQPSQFIRRLHYTELEPLVLAVSPDAREAGFDELVIPYLVNQWVEDYCLNSGASDVVQTVANDFSYLFDIRRQRLIAAWGMSGGKHSGARDSNRMSGHPLSAGPYYHRGHAIPHTLGGPTDINLVPQLGRVNIGSFRRLENLAVKTPGSLYFSYWIYAREMDPIPSGVDQGLLIAGQPPEILRHNN